MATFSVRTPAKINLGLRILGHESKRHLLDTVLYAIPLYDHLTFTLIPPSNALVSMALTALTSETVSVSAERPSLTRSAVEISTTGPFGYLTPTDDTNVVSKILAKYSDCNWQVQIDKQIPVAAGLAGGTADAAAAILALLEYEFVNEREAIEIAETEGSDLAFCYQALRHGLPYAALGTHFGEVLQQISTELQ
ncbi:MAG: hypothetical protein LBC43_00175, partial [Bifidobacteriaceae bacterium]|nr:hypothetical protein [Bifidobacteriaceae bacterium]